LSSKKTPVKRQQILFQNIVASHDAKVYAKKEEKTRVGMI